MTVFEITGSMIETAVACPASCVLDAVERPPSFPMWRGIAIHKFLERALTQSREDAIAGLKDPTNRTGKTCLAIDTAWLEKRVGPDPIVEQGYAFDLLAGTPRRIGRSFGGQGRPRYRGVDFTREVSGRADLIFQDAQRGGVWHVVDFKSGAEESPIGNPQLLFFALVLTRLPDVLATECLGTIVQVKADGKMHWKTAKYTPEIIAESHRQLARTHAAVQHGRRLKVLGRPVPTHPGEHCEWCDAKPNCPSWP